MTTKNETTLPSISVFFAFNIVTELQYNDTKFKDLLINSSASTKSIIRLSQLKALPIIESTIKINNSKNHLAKFIFTISNTASLSHINLDTLIGLIIFYIVFVNTLFFLCLADINKLSVFFNNITNELVYEKFIYLIVCRYGNAFLMWHTPIYLFVAESLNINLYYLIKIKLCCLHCCFGHLLIYCLRAIFHWIRYKVNIRVLRHLIKDCNT